MIFSLLFSLALAKTLAPQEVYFTFSFGSHRIETIEMKETTLRGKKRILARHLVDGKIQNQRLLPNALAKDVRSDFEKLFVEYKSEITPLGAEPCAVKMQTIEKRKPAFYCADTTSSFAQKSLAKWVRQTLSYIR